MKRYLGTHFLSMLCGLWVGCLSAAALAQEPGQEPAKETEETQQEEAKNDPAQETTPAAEESMAWPKRTTL
ncbi:MAG: hypothetical protein JNK90_30520, partial [Planctomycetaceae bacterium]|nr:hypothetical protein [Planctomycetaceae bacterium]